MNTAYPYTVEPQESGGHLVQFIDFEESLLQNSLR